MTSEYFDLKTSRNYVKTQMRINKVSSRRYEVFNDEEEMVYIIKRIHCDRYSVRQVGSEDKPLSFCSLKDAKRYVRGIKETWISFFQRHTRGRTFESQDASNENMRVLAEMWTNLIRQR